MKDNKIEFQELLAESNEGGTYNIRLTLVKYRDNPHPCMDSYEKTTDERDGNNILRKKSK